MYGTDGGGRHQKGNSGSGKRKCVLLVVKLPNVKDSQVTGLCNVG